MNNLPMLVTTRASHVRRIIEIVGQICEVDGQIEEARGGLPADDDAELKTQLSEQNDKMLDAVATVEVVRYL